jgi:hypothetical protein
MRGTRGFRVRRSEDLVRPRSRKPAGGVRGWSLTRALSGGACCLVMCFALSSCASARPSAGESRGSEPACESLPPSIEHSQLEFLKCHSDACRERAIDRSRAARRAGCWPAPSCDGLVVLSCEAWRKCIEQCDGSRFVSVTVMALQSGRGWMAAGRAVTNVQVMGQSDDRRSSSSHVAPRVLSTGLRRNPAMTTLLG